MATDQKGTSERSFGRRSFVKGMAATLGLATAYAAAGCSPRSLEANTESAKEYVEDELFQGCCHAICGGAARFNVHVRDGKIVKTSIIHSENDPINDHICSRGLTHAHMTYSPERIQYPMRRVEGTERGAGQWERITWDEAINEVVTKWQGYIKEFGPTSIGFCYGSGSTLSTQYAWMRLLNAFGGTQFAEYDCMASLNVGKDVFGRNLFLVGNDGYDMLKSKYIVSWGKNYTEAAFQDMKKVWQAIDGGAKLIVVDPMYSDIAAKADMWIPLRPTTDGALAMAMTKIIFDEGLLDEEYLRKNTVAPFLVNTNNPSTFLHAEDIGYTLPEGEKQAEGDGIALPNTDDVPSALAGPKDSFGRPTNYIVFDATGKVASIGEMENPELLGSVEINGVTYKTALSLLKERVDEWPIERAVEVCGISEEMIREFTALYAEGPTYLGLGFGVDRYCNGGSNTLCIYAMAIACGQVGKPGASVGGSNGGNGVFRPNVPMTDFLASWFPPPTDPPAPMSIMTSTTYLPEILETGMYNGKPMIIKSIISYCNNHLATSPDRNAQFKVEEQVEFLIAVDTFMTETCEHSDLILPNPYWFEYETISANRFNDKAIEPLFETKSDVEQMALIGQAMGFEGFDLDDASFQQLYYESEGPKAAGWSWDYFKENKIHVDPNDPADFIYGNIDYGTAWTNTPGRAAFFLENPVPMLDPSRTLDKELVCLPYFKTPNEAWPETVNSFEKNPLADKYPMLIFSTHYRLKAHTLWSKCAPLLEIRSEPTVNISPADADARGIREDDYVRVFNDRGSMIALAKIDAGMRNGVLRTEHGWWSNQHVSGEKINALTSTAVDHQWPALEHTDLLCQVERYQK
jgi:molybdopterin-containing oxidoreductase family molybdopterin binding subunit